MCNYLYYTVYFRYFYNDKYKIYIKYISNNFFNKKYFILV